MPTRPVKTHLPTVLGIAVLTAAFIATGLMKVPRASAQEEPALIDYAGFQTLTAEAGPHRQARLVDLDRFNEMRDDPETLLIDARSAEAFAMGHIEGAVNLNFADFTDEKLAQVIGAKERRILIYCNNNFTDNVAPVMLKSAPLALNIATYVNLYGYGYQNVYELDGAYSLSDERLNWATSEG